MIQFPDPSTAGPDGLLCVGGDLKVETLLSAYGQGIFPWPQDGLPLLWFSPKERGVLDFAEAHWPRRFLKDIRQARENGSRKITFNKAFGQVIEACAKIPRSHESGTWILPPMIGAYKRFHEAGYAHSVECWAGDRLVGGLYGVFVQGVFSGESMFHSETGASKLCLYALVEKLQASGLEFLDTQMVTPILETFGGKLISRDEFQRRLAQVHESPPQLRFEGSVPDL